MQEHEPQPSHETGEERERRLLENPVDNAGELYDIYHGRLAEIAPAFSLATTEEERSAVVALFKDICSRQLLVSKLLPDEDPRSYATWKQEFKASMTSTGQQG